MRTSIMLALSVVFMSISSCSRTDSSHAQIADRIESYTTEFLLNYYQMNISPAAPEVPDDFDAPNAGFGLADNATGNVITCLIYDGGSVLTDCLFEDLVALKQELLERFIPELEKLLSAEELESTLDGLDWFWYDSTHEIGQRALRMRVDEEFESVIFTTNDSLFDIVFILPFSPQGTIWVDPVALAQYVSDSLNVN